MAEFRLNEPDGIAEAAARIDAAADVTDPEQRLLARFTTGVAAMLRGDLGAGLARFTEVRSVALSDALAEDPRAPLLLGLAAGFSGDVAEAMAAGATRVDDIRRRGALGLLVPALAIRAAGRAWIGDHAGAFADAGEAAELAEQIDYAADASVAAEMLAWQSAARGLHDDAAAALARARALTDRAGTTRVAAHQALTAAFCALCRDDLARVTELLEARIAVDGGVGALGEPLGVAPLLVEAYVGLGRTDDAIMLTERYAATTPSAAPAATTALVARCLCITARADSAADAAFADAVDAHSVAGDPFEAARTRLLYGARTRRAGNRVAARDHLRAAHEAFVDMDLTHWARRAADELAATGATARRRGPEVDEALTSQETRVALLVAQGMSNREVAAALFLSPKTVERHLGNVFRKRGFRSRVDLARAYAQAPGPDPR
jgi:DNA-binding CsgD family transcriptional regulator